MTTDKVSRWLRELHPSATRAAADKSSVLHAKGVDILSMSTGEPDFVSPQAALQAAREAIDAGKTFYTPTTGIRELRQEVLNYYQSRFGLTYELPEVMVGAGAKPLLFEAFASLLNPGDEVIIPAPSWVSYIEQARFHGGVPVIVQCDEASFQLDLAAIEAAITPRTKVIVLNAPNNPTGCVVDVDTLQALCELVLRHDLILINDEIYERLLYDGRHHVNPVALHPPVRDHVLNINGASKAYAMTGWRIGFATGPSWLIKAMTALQGHLTSGPCSIAQWAALGAIRHAQADVEKMVAQFQIRKDLIVALLGAIPGIRFVAPQGAFYVFVDVRAFIGKEYAGRVITDDLVFCDLLLDHQHLAIIPGTAFSKPGFVRLTFATSQDNIRRGVALLADFLRGMRVAGHLSSTRHS